MNVPTGVPQLDLYTVKAMTLVTVLAVSGATWLAWRTNRRVVGMRSFALGLLSVALGGVLGIGRLIVPGKAIFIACNLCMVGGMTAAAQGIRAFRGFPGLPRRAVAAFAAVVSSFFLYWLFVHDNFGMRVGVISCALAVLLIDAAASMIRRVPPRERLIYWPAGIAFGFAFSYMAVRAFGAFSGRYGNGLLSPAPLEVATTICANVAYIGCAFGMLVASNTRLRYEAERMAQFDLLTSLPNRRLLLDRLLAAECRALASGQGFGLIYLDLDDFKLVNDRLGHEAGDELLRNVSSAMSETLRRGDCLARVGGDEFVVLVESSGIRSEVMALAERLRSVVARSRPPANWNHPARVSCGIAIFPDDGQSAHDVMREADSAMYRAKRRSRVTISAVTA